MNPHIYVLILNWNGKNVLKLCLDSVLAIDYPNYTTLVIDNNSSDGSREMVKNDFPQAEYLQLKQNYGFAGGYNRCFEYLRDKEPGYILLLNNDTTVDVDILNSLIEAVKKYGSQHIFGAKIFYHHNPQQIWYAGGTVNLKWGWISHKGIRNIDSEDYSLPMETDYITGCCLFTSMQVINQLDGFDERFNMYGEDVDLCLRAKEEDINCYYWPHAKLWHDVSASLGGNYSINKWKRKHIGKMKLVLKHIKPYQIPLLALPTILLSVVEMLLAAFVFFFKWRR